MSEISVVIKSYTEEDAIRQGMLQFKKVTHIEKMKTGFKPTNVKVLNQKQVGAKKWITKFYIYSYQAKCSTNGSDSYVGLKLEAEVEAGKTEALQTAKELCMERQKPMTVRVVKVLETGSNVIGEVIPNGGILGEYKITGVPRGTGTITKDEVEDMQKFIQSESYDSESEDLDV